MKPTNTLAALLERKSAEICADNDCNLNDEADEHHCDCYAYIRFDMQLLDICYPDYFQGCAAPYAAIPLPWTGSQADLEKEVSEQCDEIEQAYEDDSRLTER